MKIGCTAWAFNPSHAAPYERGIEAVGSLGFDGVELIVYDENDLRDYYTDARVNELVKLYRSFDLTLSQLTIYDLLVHGLASFDKKEKERAYDNFHTCVKLATKLGTNIISTVSQWIAGLEGPGAYPPHATYVQSPGAKQFDPKLTLKLPEGLVWADVWNNYMDSLRTCAQIAGAEGVIFAIEGHTHVIVSGADAMLRALDHVQEKALAVNLDTGWHFKQREYIPLTVHKLRGHIVHVHARDGDGVLCDTLPPGMGIINWPEVIKALADTGYDGFLSLENANYREPHKYFKAAKEYLQSVFAEYGR